MSLIDGASNVCTISFSRVSVSVCTITGCEGGVCTISVIVGGSPASGGVGVARATAVCVTRSSARGHGSMGASDIATFFFSSLVGMPRRVPKAWSLMRSGVRLAVFAERRTSTTKAKNEGKNPRIKQRKSGNSESRNISD